MKLEDYFDISISGTYELVDGLYNVNGSVRLDERVEKLPCKFGKVTGNFDCWDNDLITLEGFPTFNEIYCDDYLKSTKEYRQYKILKKLRK